MTWAIKQRNWRKEDEGDEKDQETKHDQLGNQLRTEKSNKKESKIWTCPIAIFCKTERALLHFAKLCALSFVEIKSGRGRTWRFCFCFSETIGTMAIDRLSDTALQLLLGSLLNCTAIPVPSSKVFLAHLTPAFLQAIVIGSVLCLATIFFGALHITFLGFYVTDQRRRAFMMYLAGTAPFVSVFALISMFMPKVWFLARLLSIFYFSMALYFVICLLLHIMEGRKSIVNKMNQKSSRLTVQTLPFCCMFPCLPTLKIETRKIKFCELMVMQSPAVRLFVTILSLILYFEYQDEAALTLRVIDFLFIPFLLAGIYGCHILVTMVSDLDELIPYRYIFVFRLLNIYFMFFGLQQPLFDFLARAGVFGCGTVLPFIETAYFWKNFATVIESFFVSVISTALLKPSRSAIFDRYPSTPMRCASSLCVLEPGAT